MGFAFAVLLQNVLSISKQIEYLMHYKIHLRQLVGKLRAEEIVTNAVFVISAGSNDFLQNYYVEPTRAKQFKVEAYIDFLVSRVTDYLKVAKIFIKNSWMCIEFFDYA